MEFKERAREEKVLKKKLENSIKHRKKVEKEKSRQDAKLKKIREQQALSNRLLSEDEKNLLLRRKYTHALDEAELNKINKKLQDDKKEQIRRKKLANKQKKISGKMKKLNEKFSKLNDFVGNVRARKSEKSTKNGQVQIYDIMLDIFRKMEFQLVIFSMQ